MTITSSHGAAAASPAETPGDAAIALHGLTKRYGARAAVADLTMHVPLGAVAGFVGPNGAGKTTAMAMMLGLVRPSAGTGTILGQPITRPGRYLGRVGALIEGPGFHPGLSGVDNLRVLVAIGGHDPRRIPVVLDQVGLAGRGDDRYRQYSLGMKQRMGIAGALLCDPQLVILDEPTNGLDPAGIIEIRQLITDIAAEGRTVLVSSHLLSELQHVCTWLLVLDQGALRFQGPTAELADRAGTRLVLTTEHAADTVRLAELLGDAGHVAAAHADAVVVQLTDGDGHAVAAAANRRAADAGIVLAGLHQHRPSLEDQVLTMIGGQR